MSSIISEKFGKRWHNATDLSSINDSIAIKTQQLNNATMLLNQAVTAINNCGNSASGCLSKTGRHISTWREQRDANAPAVAQYKQELKELLALQASLATTQSQSAAAVETTAKAQEAVTNANTAETTANLTKYLIYGGIAIVVIIGAIVAFKYFRKK
jgi:ABC-type transporter Mla subunit MlaD